MGGISGLISLLCLVSVSSLNIGDTASSLEGTQWLKGSAPVFKNQVTVLEIWRPSCSHCKAQIPHLTSLQKQYGSRISIVAISKEPLDTVEEFVKTNGNQMEFTVGRISKELGEPYMKGVSAIPYAYLINKDGIVVWKGNLSGIDDILARTVEGKIDIEQLKNIANLETSLNDALNTNNPNTIAPIDKKLLLADPANELGLDVGIKIAKYNNEPAKVKEIFDKVELTGLEGFKANALAMMLVSESDLAYCYPEAALKFSAYSLKQEPNNDKYMDVYARVLYSLGDIEKAILWEKKALALNPKESSYQFHLDYYMTVKTIREKSNYNSITRLQDIISVK